MRKVIVIIILFTPFFYGCKNKKDINEEFKAIKSVDYSGFRNMSIANERGNYLITYQHQSYKVERKFLNGDISSIKRVSSNSKNSVPLTKQNTNLIKQAFQVYNKIGAFGLTVDKEGNVFITLFWNDRCTYYFLKLSEKNTLKDLDKQYYRHYDDNWYLYKECSKTG